jgi:ABC-type cobalamin transport system ATPase subunit
MLELYIETRGSQALPKIFMDPHQLAMTSNPDQASKSAFLAARHRIPYFLCVSAYLVNLQSRDTREKLNRVAHRLALSFVVCQLLTLVSI